MTITPAELRLITAIADLEDEPSSGVRGRELARRLWPDAPGWKRHANCGPHGSTIGSGMPRTAGCLAGKLSRKSERHKEPLTWYIGWRDGWTLTAAGRRAVEEGRRR